MDGVQPKDFGVQPENEIGEEPKEPAPGKRKPRHKKFIDLQNQPPKRRPPLQD
jgi:hypothetical protein